MIHPGDLALPDRCPCADPFEPAAFIRSWAWPGTVADFSAPTGVADLNGRAAANVEAMLDFNNL